MDQKERGKLLGFLLINSVLLIKNILHSTNKDKKKKAYVEILLDERMAYQT